MKENIIRVAICDDEVVFRSYLKEQVINSFAAKGQRCTVESFSSGEQLIAQKSDIVTYDIVFLDVDMEQMSGVDTAERIRQTDQNVFIVFVTNFIDYAVEGYRVNAIRYLLKSAENFDELLQEAVNAILQKIQSGPKNTQYRFQEGEVCFSHDRLIYIESKLHQLDFYILEEKDKSEHNGILFRQKAESSSDRDIAALQGDAYSIRKYTKHGTLNRTEMELSDETYIRIHQSYLVNPAFVKKIEKRMVILFDETSLPISKARYQATMAAWVRYKGMLSW